MKMLKPAKPGVHNRTTLAISILAALATTSVYAAEEEAAIEEIVVLGSARTFSAATTSESMENQQNPITSILSIIDNLPGVNVTEGDTFGFDDWSTTINLRGYQTNLSEQQVGTTIDGFPNGESNYGGGAKANRYIDSANAGGVVVNQGTADISSRTLEALGGTLNFLTDDPVEFERFRTQLSNGDFDSRRYYGRYDTGMLLDDTTKAWLSVSHNEATDWMEGSAQNERDHIAGKFITALDSVTFTGYFSYDEIQEDNYQRITTDEFAANPDWDRLTGDWSGVPYVDQLYRRGWSTMRENRFGYLKADWQLTESLMVNLGVYGHRLVGHGDWVPPQIINVSDDGPGNPHSELVTGNTVYGGSALGNIYFVDAAGNALTPDPGCVSSITFPYGGAGPEYDPACYGAGALAVQSFRHTHYKGERYGYTADFEFNSNLGGDMENSLRGGFWYEDATRYEFRDWHKITDTRAGFQFESPAYWVQYDLKFPRDTLNWYLANTLSWGNLSVNAGIREFGVETDRVDNFGVQALRSLDSDTDTIYSTGATFQTPIDGLELFAGYSENVKPLTGTILEREGTDVSGIEAETAKNKELGLRYVSGNIVGSAVYFDNEFNNRLEFFGNQLAGNIPDYLIGTAGRYDNVGGIETNGFELALAMELSENWSVYSSYTYTDASYIGTGLGAAADAALGLAPGNSVVGTPENMYVVSLDWYRGNFSAGLSNKFVDDRFIDRGNATVAENYSVTDFYFNINGEGISDFLQGYQIGIVVNNLTDKRYLGGISGFGSWIGAPRTAVFTLSADF
jgi:outer membrane receptor for Fe3+-dicitrate